MAATVINGLSASHWAGWKPADYKGQDLDSALKAYEPLAGKTITFASSLMPAAPKLNIRAIDGCIADLKTSITEMEKGKAILNQVAGALRAVQSAGFKVSADLNKLSKGKDVDEQKYQAAATVAGSIASSAAEALSNY